MLNVQPKGRTPSRREFSRRLFSPYMKPSKTIRGAPRYFFLSSLYEPLPNPQLLPGLLADAVRSPGWFPDQVDLGVANLRDSCQPVTHLFHDGCVGRAARRGHR